MTVLVREGIDMAAIDEQALDALFDQMTVPEGYRAEIVGGAIHMSPQRRVHWEITRRVVRALEDAFGMDALIFSDVRIDFPGLLNGFCPDVAKMRDGAGRSGGSAGGTRTSSSSPK